MRSIRAICSGVAAAHDAARRKPPTAARSRAAIPAGNLYAYSPRTIVSCATREIPSM